MPFSFSIHYPACKEDVLIKWANAIEDLVREVSGGRPPTKYTAYMSKDLEQAVAYIELLFKNSLLNVLFWSLVCMTCLCFQTFFSNIPTRSTLNNFQFGHQ